MLQTSKRRYRRVKVLQRSVTDFKRPEDARDTNTLQTCGDVLEASKCYRRVKILQRPQDFAET
jgi:hypothetical protein